MTDENTHNTWNYLLSHVVEIFIFIASAVGGAVAWFFRLEKRVGRTEELIVKLTTEYDRRVALGDIVIARVNMMDAEMKAMNARLDRIWQEGRDERTEMLRMLRALMRKTREEE